MLHPVSSNDYTLPNYITVSKPANWFWDNACVQFYAILLYMQLSIFKIILLILMNI